jgi:predicted lipid-binding transport protein (Tim44 family)
MDIARRADTNNDNAVDRAEFLAAANVRFQRADANNDGTVSAAERQAMRERMRDRRGRGRDDDDRPAAMTPPPAGSD